MIRGSIFIGLCLAVAVVGSLAVAGSSYTPPASTGGGVEGDGTGVTDASAFRTALGLGTAATLTAGTSANNAVQLDGTGKLPAVDGSALTGIPVGIPEGGLTYQALLKVSDIDYESGWTSLGGAAFHETSAFTAADDLLTSIAGQSWSSGTQLLALTGTDTAGLVSTGTSAGNVVVLDGSARLPAVDGSQLTGISGGGSSPQVDIYTAADTWTMPVGAVMVEVEVQAGGGGGGSGAYYTSGTARNGGAGGGGGGRSVFRFKASDLSSPVSITVGAGGTGGASVDGGANANGNAGSNGGASSFGSYLYADGGNGGNGGTSSGSAAQGGTGGGGLYAGGNGGNGGYSGTGSAPGVASALGGGGGGGGGGITAANTAGDGDIGGSSAANVMSAAGQAGGTAGNASVGTGGDGDDAPAGTYYGGGGGGGGRGQQTAYQSTAPGGHGGTFGGGGGGGGAGTRYASGTVPSGAGGNGADGFVRVVTWF